MIFRNYSIENETDFAMLVKLPEFTTWFPKSKIDIHSKNEIWIDGDFYRQKEHEIKNPSTTIIKCDNYRDVGKTINIAVNVIDDSLNIVGMDILSIPKSLIVNIKNNGIVVHKWIVEKLVREIKQKVSTDVRVISKLKVVIK